MRHQSCACIDRAVVQLYARSEMYTGTSPSVDNHFFASHPTRLPPTFPHVVVQTPAILFPFPDEDGTNFQDGGGPLD